MGSNDLAGLIDLGYKNKKTDEARSLSLSDSVANIKLDSMYQNIEGTEQDNDVDSC